MERRARTSREVGILSVLALSFALVPARGAAQDLSDSEVAHIAVTANSIDIEMGELAVARAEAEAVLGFAETMIRDHRAVNERAAALAERLGLTPQDNPVSRSWRADAGQARARLSKLEGTGFERAYLAHEVAHHEAVLEVLEGTLIPAAENDELRALLAEVRPAIVTHLEEARSLRAAQEGGT